MELIVAVDSEWGIGYKGELLARVRDDLRNFKALTEGKTVILGSNTLATFPGGKPLKGRKNLVLHPSPDYTVEGAEVVHSLEELYAYVDAHPEQTFVVIGGASVYRQLLPRCTRAYVTKFERVFEKDVYFEDLDADPAWKQVFCGEVRYSNAETDTVGDMPYRYTVYERRPARRRGRRQKVAEDAEK